MPLCLLKNVGFAALASLFLLHIFLSLFGKKGGDTSMCTFSYVKFYVDVDIANICSVLLCLSSNVGCALVACLFRLHIFLSLFGKKGGDTMCTVSYVKFYVDVDIANICSVLLCLSSNVGCALVACLLRFHIFLSLSRKMLGVSIRKVSYVCVRLMLRLLIFILCCSVFPEMVVVLVSLRGDSFIFFLCL